MQPSTELFFLVETYILPKQPHIEMPNQLPTNKKTRIMNTPLKINMEPISPNYKGNNLPNLPCWGFMLIFGRMAGITFHGSAVFFCFRFSLWRLLQKNLEENRSGPAEKKCGNSCWWLKYGDCQLRLVAYPIIYRVLYISGGDRRISEPSTVVVWIQG